MSPKPSPIKMTEKAASLKARLVTRMGILLLAGTVVMYLAARVYGMHAADISYDRLLAGSALSIAETLSVDGEQVRVDIPYAALDMLSAAPEDRVFYRVIGPDGKTVTGYDDLARLPKLSEREIPVSEIPAPHFFNAFYRGETVRFVMLGRKLAQSGLRGWVWVQVGQTRLAREALAHELLLSTVLPLAGLTILALGMAWWVVGHALRPLNTIGSNLAAREPHDLRPLSVPAPAEIRPLIHAMNGFMHRLETTIEGLRAFIGEAAHQIRTPLATAYMQTQMTLDEYEPGQMRRNLQVVERNLSRLTRLVNQLLSDAMVMHRTTHRNFERLDMQQVIRRALRDAVPKSSRVHVRFTGLPHPAPLYGDAILLGEALKNLIDNAIRHGCPDTDMPVEGIEIILREDHTTYRLEVCDRGPGISPEHQTRLFQRFERGDTHATGAGLGMAIVQRVIENHGGRIELEPRQGGGLKVCLILEKNR